MQRDAELLNMLEQKDEEIHRLTALVNQTDERIRQVSAREEDLRRKEEQLCKQEEELRGVEEESHKHLAVLTSAWRSAAQIARGLSSALNGNEV